jgi:hypothetical protein
MPVPAGPLPEPTVARPDAGNTLRPATGVTARPNTGDVERPLSGTASIDGEGYVT